MSKLQEQVSTRRGWFKLRPLTIALAVAMSVAIVVSPAAAAKPTKTPLAFPTFGTLTDLCAFPINLNGNLNGTQTDFYNSSGGLIRSHWQFVEQDTFSANGKTLQGLPFTVNMEWIYDGSGNLIHLFGTGVMEKIPLPDGSLFISAGRVDFLNHPETNFILSPDNGNPGNVAAFCAALAP